MANEVWFVGDLHLGHKNIITFKDNGGKLIRPFESIEAHDEALIDNFNALVKDEDRVYFFGDLVMKRSQLPTLARFKGRKKLLKGNHDILGLKDYMPYFEDISAYRIYPDLNLICSHIPVHPGQLMHRFKCNVHGHLHANKVRFPLGKDKESDEFDPRYINICPEHTDFKPVNLEDIKLKILKL